jgi:hypothetical protein
MGMGDGQRSMKAIEGSARESLSELDVSFGVWYRECLKPKLWADSEGRVESRLKTKGRFYRK